MQYRRWNAKPKRFSTEHFVMFEYFVSPGLQRVWLSQRQIYSSHRNEKPPRERALFNHITLDFFNCSDNEKDLTNEQRNIQTIK